MTTRAGPTISTRSAASTVAPFISISGLTKSFGDATVLNGLDLAIDEGEFLVLLGPSGCGKTTTMRCIVGLETADAGRIEVAGSTVFDADRAIDVAPNKRDMGMVFQSYALWPHKNVHGNVGFPLRMQRIPKRTIVERVDETLELVGLGGMGKRSINTLSGGQMQRVALARSLVMDPTILLLDEPLSNLDAKLRVHLRHELREIQQRVGVTTVYVTHDQDEALGLADRIIVMRAGEIAQQGTPEQVYTSPASPFVADFLGVSNQFPVTVAAGGRVTLGEGIELHASDRRTDPVRDAPAVACVRPERLDVHGPDEAPSGPDLNRMDGTVLSRQYQGDRLRYHVTLDRGPDVFCEGSAALTPLDRDDRCVVTVAASDLLILDDDSAVGAS